MTTDQRTYLWNKRFSVLHQALANRLYHQRCAAIFEMRDRVAKLVSLIGASAVFVSLATPETAKIWAALAFAGAAASLVFRWPEKARIANEKMHLYAAIHADISAVGETAYTDADLNTWAARISAITEPSPNRLLWSRMCREAELSLGGTPDKPTMAESFMPALIIP